MKIILLTLTIATSSHQLTNAQVYAQIEAINNAAAAQAVQEGYSQTWVTPPEMFEATTTVSQETFEQVNPLPWCGNVAYQFQSHPCNPNYSHILDD
jgi:hypothetical protein